MHSKLLSSLLLMLAATSAVGQELLPSDPDVRRGTLKNGMTYYIRHNAKEPGLADYYIAQRVGSILEEPRQRGLAHFLEHMAFNGTKNFPGKGGKPGIVPWCETIGVKFGANLNAYTSIDQTVYHIGSAPTNRDGVVDSCLLVLHDWSHYLLLEDKEIDKERGVIHEEWRTRRASKAVQRMMEDALPTVYAGTKYADCMPIGSMDIVDNFPYQDLRDYYDKWYRPDLQAIVVVGDIDVDRIEGKIRKTFGSIPMPRKAAERIYYPVSDNERMIVTTLRDAEQPIVLAHLYMKREATPDKDKAYTAYLRDDYACDLVTSMLNSRLAEMRQLPNPPFMSATAHAGAFFVSRTKDAFSLSVSCNENNILGGIMTAVAAAERARQHGFTADELRRAKALFLSAAEKQYNGRNDRRNAWYVNRCVNNFLTGEPLLSAQQHYDLQKRFAEEVTLEEVNRAARELITDSNQVCVIYSPDKPEIVLPSNTDIEQVITTVQKQEYSPFKEEQLAGELMAEEPQAGSIVSEKAFRHGFTEYILSNGMRVYVKPTNYQSDEITMSIRGEGGTSLCGNDDIPNFSLVSSSVQDGGVAGFDATTLRKMLQGKQVKVRPSVGSKGQSVGGTCAKKDLKTMLQLAHLYFTQPRRDTTAWQSLLSRTHSFLTNRNASPKVDYNDSINAILYGHHPRLEPVTQATLERADYDRIMQIYKERFADAANFKAVIIGDVDTDALRPLLCTYLASLPATNKGEQTNYQALPKMVKEDGTHIFRKKIATPLANVSIFYSADVEFTPKNDLVLDFLTRTLKIAYTDSVREEKGGTYGVSVDFSLERDETPTTTMRISYNADPTRYEELNPIIYQQLRNIAEQGPEPSSMQKIRTYLLKQYDQVAITNDYWSYIIWHELDDNADFDNGYKQLVEQITPQEVQQMARKLLSSGWRTEVTMLSGQ